MEPIEETDDTKKDEGEVRDIGLEGGSEGEGTTIDALGAQGGVEADVGDGDGHPGEEAGDGGEVLEPLEDVCGAGARGGAGEVGEEGDGPGYEDAEVGHAAVRRGRSQFGYLVGERIGFGGL